MRCCFWRRLVAVALSEPAFAPVSGAAGLVALSEPVFAVVLFGRVWRFRPRGRRRDENGR